MRPNQGAVPNFNLGGRRLVTLMVGRCVMIPVTVMVTDWREVASRRLNGRDTPTTRAKHEGGWRNCALPIDLAPDQEEEDA